MCMVIDRSEVSPLLPQLVKLFSFIRIIVLPINVIILFRAIHSIAVDLGHHCQQDACVELFFFIISNSWKAFTRDVDFHLTYKVSLILTII